MAIAVETVTEMSEEEFERQTLDVIKREFGLSGLVRFIRSYRSGRGNYTTENAAQPSRPLEEIWSELELKGLTQA